MANFVHKYVQDLQQEVNVRNDGTLTFEGDNLSNEIQVEITNGGAAASVSGTVVGYAIRANGSTVVMAGTLTGNVASVVLPEACFAYLGMLGVSVQLVTGSVKTTLFKAVYQVEEISTSVQVDPGDVVPDLADVIAMKEAVEAATDAAEAAAEEALGNFAGAFSASVAYTAGQYVTYTDGKFYRFTADHAVGSWTGTDVVAVTAGGELSELKSHIETIATIEPLLNMFNKDDSGNVLDGSFITSTGAISNVPDSGFGYSHLIPIKNNEVYSFYASTLYGDNRNRAFLYNGSGEFLEMITGTMNGNICTVLVNNSSAAYMRVNVTVSSISNSLMMVVEGVNFPSTFAAYQEYADLHGAFEKTFGKYRSANLFNKNDGNNKTDWYIQSNGTENNVGGSGYCCTYFIPIENGETYTFATSSMYGDNRNRAFLYDVTGAFLEMITGTIDNGIVTVTIDNSSAKYIRLNYTTGIASTMMLVEGSTYPAEYIAYASGYKLTDGTLISDAQYQEIMGKIAGAAGTLEGNPLKGKKAAYAGDSICYGYGYTGGYAKIIADDNDMTFSNVAVSGAKLVGDIIGQLSSLPNDADYYIIEGGVNDYASGSYTLGEIQNWGYTIDETTVTGAVQYIFRYLYNNYPGKKYGFVFPHRIQQYGSGWDTMFKPAIKEALKKWGIPFIDLEELVMPLNMANAYKNAYTDNGDGWHPNEQGYKLLYVPKITAWMKTL